MSISIYRTGSAGGEIGPTGFLPAGKIRNIFYTYDYLRRHWGTDGSTIAMTDNG